MKIFRKYWKFSENIENIKLFKLNLLIVVSKIAFYSICLWPIEVLYIDYSDINHSIVLNYKCVNESFPKKYPKSEGS